MFQNFEDWYKASRTIHYSRTYTKGNYTRTWHNQAYEMFPGETNPVARWNELAELQHKQHPENGVWTYAEE